MSRIEIGTDALSILPEVVSELAGGGREAPRVVLATDETPMRRADCVVALGSGTVADVCKAAMLGAIEASTGAHAEAIVGKPSPHMAATLLERLGVPARDTLLVGDRLATDVRMANEAGIASALVLTGATDLEEALGSPDRPDYVIEHLGDLLTRGVEPRAAAWEPGRG